MSQVRWVKRWNSWIAPTPTLPGVWRRKKGGFLIRARVKDPRTDKLRDVVKNLPTADAAGAYSTLQRELDKIRTGATAAAPLKIRFSSYAVSLLERKIVTGRIQSAHGRAQWGSVLENHLLPAFGEHFVDQIRPADLEAWRTKVGRRVQAGEYSPHTANDWLAILRVVLNHAVKEYDLPRNPIANVERFDTSTYATYTEEEPNALTPDEARAFLGAMHQHYPQHFTFTTLGFATGSRPSTLRPLRHKGPTPDLSWSDGMLRVRRSHTRGDEVMESTKTKRHQRIALPPELLDLLRWHLEQLPEGPMQDSELLFPSTTGSFRSPTVLDKPFKHVAKIIGLTKRFTPRGMRRTFQDLTRAAGVDAFVTRAVSGHATEQMHQHYSSVNQDEVRAGLAKVISLAGVREAMAQPVLAGASSGEHGGEHGGEAKKASRR